MEPPRAARIFRVGDPIDDLCRQCKDVRSHAVLSAGEGRVERVQCATCGSQHNYRGGDERAVPRPEGGQPPPAAIPGARRAAAPRPAPSRAAFPAVSDRERILPDPLLLMSPDQTPVDLEMLIRRILREESGLTPVAPAEKWRGGSFVLRPGREGVQEKSWPIETFFHKVVMLRNRLRVLEQQVNALEIPDDAKARLQAYITACYGSLTSFNVLFADEEDRFAGAGGAGE